MCYCYIIHVCFAVISNFRLNTLFFFQGYYTVTLLFTVLSLILLDIITGTCFNLLVHLNIFFPLSDL